MCQMAFFEYVYGSRGRRLDRNKGERISQADKLLKQGVLIYDKEILSSRNFEKNSTQYSDIATEKGNAASANRPSKRPSREKVMAIVNHANIVATGSIS
jgi:hypothetical protein